MADAAYTPPESADHVLFRVQNLALLKILGPKKGRAFLRAMSLGLAEAVSFSEIVPIYAPSGAPAKRAATLEAADIFRRDLNVFVAGMSR